MTTLRTPPPSARKSITPVSGGVREETCRGGFGPRGHRRLFGAAALMGVALMTSLRATSAHAQQIPTDRSIDVQLFAPAIGAGNYVTVDGATVTGHKMFTIGAYVNYQKSPWALVINRENSQSEIESSTLALDHQVTTDLVASFGLLNRYQIGVAVPVTLLLQGQDFTDRAEPSGTEISGAGIGDIRIMGKGLLVSKNDMSFAAAAGLSLPTGDAKRFLGDRTVTGQLRFIGEYNLGDIRAGGFVGVLFRDESTLFAAELSHQALYGVATEYRPHEQVGLIAEVFGRNGFSRFVDTSPLEADLAMRVNVTPMVSLTAGGGAGLIKGIGAPQVRAFLGASFQPDYRDSDGDGVYDINDRCPDALEDRDGFKDSDGCPEIDNDGDALLDEEDKCPNEAEDVDQHEDEDGCPEPDNDGDGVLDINDPCPNAPEDGTGKRPDDGCPSSAEDEDGDTISDARDQCPDEPEDMDGFQDGDGCPDVDNDGDGAPDPFDNCPNEPEDPDGFQDEDGCPDPDNDRDGIPDALDQCPAEKETLNLRKDEDGCPDPGTELVRIDDRVIHIDGRINFNGAELDDVSARMVGLVALLLKGYPELGKVQVDVAAGTEGQAKARAESVKNVLVDSGVDASRLTTAGRVARARVSFVIEEIDEADAAK